MPAQFPLPLTNLQQTEDRKPRTVISAKKVDLALISYVDDFGTSRITLGIVGDSHVNLLNAQSFGISNERTDQGPASSWMTEGVLKALGRKK